METFLTTHTDYMQALTDHQHAESSRPEAPLSQSENSDMMLKKNNVYYTCLGIVLVVAVIPILVKSCIFLNSWKLCQKRRVNKNTNDKEIVKISI